MQAIINKNFHLINTATAAAAAAVLRVSYIQVARSSLNLG